jgi:SNF2 family DNA or RNA helicase
MNLLRPKEEIPTSSEFNEMFIKTQLSTKVNKYEIINKDVLSDYLNGYISYYQGAPDYTFPERIEKIVKCPMSKYQYNCYKTVEESEGGFADANDIFKMPNNFLLGSRMISNIAFPNKLANEQGYNAFTKIHMSIENLSNYSSKFSYLMDKILSKSGLHFVYSNFKSYAGIKTITKILKYNGFKNYSKDGPGKLRYAIWSGDETIQEKEMIRNVFNHPDNVNGSKIKIIIGSPAIKEGVTLLRVKYVHVLEPYWNMSRYEQVIGRAIRFCSHKDVEKDKRKVKVYLYLATPPEDIIKKNKDIFTVDEHILKLALRKKQIIDQFETVIKESAIDYYLNQ